MQEPKISEIEKLIKHFRETNRSHELHEVLSKHGVKRHDELAIEPDTNELNPEALVIDKMEKKSFFEKIKKYWANIIILYKEKWYVRYGTYYVLLFLLLFSILNAPLFLNSFKKIESEPQIISYQSIEQPEMEKSAPLDVGEVIPSSSQIVIPKINVTAPIIFVDTRDEKTIQNNLTQGAVHYSGTAMPGEVGNSFITGHSSNFWWIKGSYNYIFLNLNKLTIGDQLKIYHNGNKYVYQVSEVKTVEPTDVSVLEQTSTPTLTLMTCTPPGTNWKRLIVKLDQISPKYFEPVVVTKEEIISPDNLPSTDTNTTGGMLGKLWDWVISLFKD